MLPLQTPIASRSPLPRSDSLTVIVAIMVLAGLAWTDIYLRTQSMGTSSLTTMDSIHLAGSHGTFWKDGAVFLPMWSVMMAAMMLLSTMPMVIAFETINRSRRGSGEAYVPTWVFVAGYAIVWVLSGVPGYLTKVALTALADPFALRSVGRRPHRGHRAHWSWPVSAQPAKDQMPLKVPGRPWASSFTAGGMGTEGRF